MKINTHNCKRLNYKVIDLEGKELMKFFTWKVAMAYAIENDAILLHNMISKRIRRSANPLAA